MIGNAAIATKAEGVETSPSLVIPSSQGVLVPESPERSARGPNLKGVFKTTAVSLFTGTPREVLQVSRKKCVISW